jgi:transcriptional regulator of heat shock response
LRQGKFNEKKGITKNHLNKLCTFIRSKMQVMSTIEIKQELHDIINKSDQKFLKLFYKLAKSSIYQLKEEEMILDGEKDIAAGRIHSQDEVQKIIESWKK